jgi:hypothetical protein
MSEVYSIMDMERYATSLRANAAMTYAKSDITTRLDEYITIPQVCTLIDNNIVGHDDEDRPLIDENGYNTIFEEIRVWLYNASLARLAANDEVQCAWDDDLNEMVFWIPEAEVKKLLESEQKASDATKPKSIKANRKPKRKDQ